MRYVIIAVALALTGCAGPKPKPDLPVATLVKVPVATYVPMDPALTKRCIWAREGEPSQVFGISNGRKRCLLQYEAQFDVIGQLQGKPVPSPASE